MKNQDIRDKARIRNVRFWEIAKNIGCNAGTLSVWLREEVTGDRRQRILDAIDEIAEERKRGIET